MPRETARAKADRLLLEGRVVILEAGRHGVVAKVRGEGTIHRAAFQFGTWACTCPARTDQCSHLLALRRVVAVDLDPRPGRPVTSSDTHLRGANGDASTGGKGRSQGRVPAGTPTTTATKENHR